MAGKNITERPSAAAEAIADRIWQYGEDVKWGMGKAAMCRLDFAQIVDEGLKEQAAKPIPMLLFCPRCRAQHVDAPEPERGWENPPHRSHLCHSCGTVWRPADIPTDGVASIESRGGRDTWPPLTEVVSDERSESTP